MIDVSVRNGCLRLDLRMGVKVDLDRHKKPQEIFSFLLRGGDRSMSETRGYDDVHAIKIYYLPRKYQWTDSKMA